VAKGAAGYFGGSTAMLADAAHSFGDLVRPHHVSCAGHFHSSPNDKTILVESEHDKKIHRLPENPLNGCVSIEGIIDDSIVIIHHQFHTA